MAVLPVDNPSGDLQADYLGAGIASVVVGNLGSISGLTVLSRSSTAPYETRRNDLEAMHREIGADYVLDLAMKSAAPRAEVVVRLRKPGAAVPVWEQTIGGDSLTVERTLLDSLAQVLEREALSRRLNAAEYARVHKVPTTSGQALLAKWRETLAGADPMLHDELKFFSDVAKMGKAEVLMDSIAAMRRK